MKTAVRDEAKKLFARLRQEVGGHLRAAEAYATIDQIEALIDGGEPEHEAHKAKDHEHKPHGHAHK